MRVLAVIVGVLFMLLGALTIAFSFAYMHDSRSSTDSWTCTTTETGSSCGADADSVQDMIVDASLSNTFQIIGATLFVSGSVLNAGAVAASGRRA
ncbi:hypothetical protein ACQBJO_16560 [Janibacter sp. G349]|uniref:hypothetical protein n=1 Tax=unclassified Janibacter TaxID=2649294 RepID=UPI0020CE58D2|nr:hypothetical protein [Janibacter sp. CX7]UTT66051.1 hypothetical protein NMQ01_15390 [Janibacter sp. CX7]